MSLKPKAKELSNQVKTKLDSISMEYLYKFKSTVHSVAAQVSQALPGNPIFREYECHEQIASAGPGHAWKIYSGTKHSTKQVGFYGSYTLVLMI